MGKSMYNFGKHDKEKARQQKQMDKASKRLMAKQIKTNIRSDTPIEESNIAEPGRAEDIAKGTA
jgi:hypothetical protein